MNTPHNLVRILLESEKQISQLEGGSLRELYSLLHRIASQILSVDAFYVCLFDPSTQSLHFVYNFEGIVFEDPIVLPLGDGPTSWVIRNQLAFVLKDDNTNVQDGGVYFGDVEKKTRSAIHLPIRFLNSDNSVSVLGVVSAQSYTVNAYEQRAISAFQSLADRVGMVLPLYNDLPEFLTPLIKRPNAIRRSEASSIASFDQTMMAETFGKMIKRIIQRTTALDRLLPANLNAARAVVKLLLHECSLIQTEAARFYTADKAEPRKLTSTSCDLLTTLTSSEQKVLQALASGGTNASIARDLHVSANTIKFHCASIYRKLGVTNRAQAVHLYSASVFFQTDNS